MNVSKESVEIKNLFRGTVPLIFAVMAEKQILPTYWPMIKDAVANDKGIQDPAVKEGLMAALSTQCDNSYCFVAHSYYLCGLGFTVESIDSLVRELRFPTQVVEDEKWSLVLKWVFLFGRPLMGPTDATDNSNRVIRQLTSTGEYRCLFKICSVIDMLNRFSEFYSDEIRVENEKSFFDSSAELKLPIPDLVKYHAEFCQLQSKVERPVVTICMYCKNIRDSVGKWHALESVLSALDRNSMFSHGICPDCHEKSQR